MHDILEGTAECVLRQVLKGLLSSGVISKKDVEDISLFEFGPNDTKNKPAQINMSFVMKKANLRGTASGKWCLLRFTPLILGWKVPEGNADWELLLQFREIVDIVFAPEIEAKRLAYLDVLVQTFLTEFANRYGRQVISPKMHYMVHYARWVREVGPLKHLWSMRFEGKHQELKKQALCVKNFKNITFTLSRRHQLKQSFQMNFFELYEGLSTSQSKPVDVGKLPECAKGLLPPTTHEVKFAAIDKCKFRCGSVLVSQNSDCFDFLEIESLFVASGRLYILTRTLIIERFDRHRFCYVVSRSDQQQIHETADSFAPCLLDLYKNGEIVPKWELW
ncbi:hypothetical protein MTO96_013668 [Rhipicephalus appendiculatus]